jgi:Cof subfamily protein (haloacid dehalogenase superfamily)
MCGPESSRTPPRVRLLALDIDGTLLRSDKSLGERTRAVLERARERGVRVVLVTGRRYPSARRVAEQLGGEVPLIVHNGALVVERGVVSRCRPLARATALRAIEVGRAVGMAPVLHCGLNGEGLLLVEAGAPQDGLVGYYLERAREEVRVVADLASALAAQPPIQVMFGGSRQATDTLLGSLREALGSNARVERTVYPASGVVLLDVIDPTVGKAEALAYVQEQWGLSPAETLAIGDNWNDRDMIEAAGRGFVMGNADPELLALGLPTLPSNDDDGVAWAIERHVLSEV